MKKCRLAPEVEQELDGIWFYIASNSGSIEIADRISENITQRFWLLARNPYIGRRRDADLRRGLRSFPADDYVIIYRVENDAVLILHVAHGSRNVQALLAD